MGTRRDSADDDSSSSMASEVNESLLKTTTTTTERWPRSNHDRGRRSCFARTLGMYNSVVNTALLVTILVLLLVRLDTNKPEKTAIGGDLSGFAPKFAQQIVKFEPDPGFVPEDPVEFFSNETRQKWLDLVPKGLGYVEVGMAYQYDNLPTPLPSYSPNTVFTTSVTHQLHCLHTIIDAYYSYSTNNSDRLMPETVWHIPHCFDYLRQSIMCCGDVALEGTQTTFPEGTDGSDGWDAKHVCRDYSQVYTYLTRKRANNAEWI